MIGMDLAARACFEPGAAASMLTKLGRVEKEMEARQLGMHIPKFLRTHPLSEARPRRALGPFLGMHTLPYPTQGLAPQRCPGHV